VLKSPQHWLPAQLYFEEINEQATWSPTAQEPDGDGGDGGDGGGGGEGGGGTGEPPDGQKMFQW